MDEHKSSKNTDPPPPIDALNIQTLRALLKRQRELDAVLIEAISRVPASPSELDGLGVDLESYSHQTGRAQVAFAARMERELAEIEADKKLSTRRSPYKSVKDRLSQMLHINPGEVQKRLDVAHAIAPGSPVAAMDNDRELEAAHPITRAAFDNSDLSVPMSARIVSAVDRLRTPIEQVANSFAEAEALLAELETDLVSTAQSATPKAVERSIKNWEHRINALGVQPSQRMKQDYQGAFYKGKRFGFHEWMLRLDDLQHETLLTAAAPEVNPRSANHDSSDLGELSLAADENGKPIEPPKDQRSINQKRLDGAIHAMTVGLRTGKLSTNGGYQPQIVVNIDHKTLESELNASALFRSDAVHSGPINPIAIRQLACNGELIPVVLGSKSQVVDAGNRNRLFSAEQRKILYARDRGCTFPGCTSGVDRCEAHHVQEYSRGGVTTLENAAMVCRHHHHLVHETDWMILMRDGVPFWSPPFEEDPSQPLMRNTYFHPEKSFILPRQKMLA